MSSIVEWRALIFLPRLICIPLSSFHSLFFLYLFVHLMSCRFSPCLVVNKHRTYIFSSVVNWTRLLGCLNLKEENAHIIFFCKKTQLANMPLLAKNRHCSIFRMFEKEKMKRNKFPSCTNYVQILYQLFLEEKIKYLIKGIDVTHQPISYEIYRKSMEHCIATTNDGLYEFYGRK